MNSSKEFKFPRNIYGMVRNPTTQRFSGGMDDIAHSEEITSDVLERIGDIVKIGFEETGSPAKHIYSFFPIKKNQFVLCHSESIEESDNTKRGTLLFTDFILVTEDKLNELNWNLQPIFDIFDKSIPYLEKKERALTPYIFYLNHINNSEKLLEIRRQKNQIKTILAEFLASNEKVNIQFNYKDSYERLSLLCNAVLCLPAPLAKFISFSTLANGSKSTARIIFPNDIVTDNDTKWNRTKQSSENIQPGNTYINWLDAAIDKIVDFTSFREMLLLKLPRVEIQIPFGDTLDFAINYLYDKEEINQLLTESQKELSVTVNFVIKYRTIFTPDEATDWISKIFVQNIQSGPHTISRELILSYSQEIGNIDFREEIIDQVVEDTFISNRNYNTQAIADFITNVDNIFQKTQHKEIKFLTDELLQAYLKTDSYWGLVIWNKIQLKQQRFSEYSFVVAALRNISVLETNGFEFFLENINIPTNYEVLKEIQAALDRSNLSIDAYPSTTKFLSCLLDDAKILDDNVDVILYSLAEIKNINWLLLILKYTYSQGRANLFRNLLRKSLKHSDWISQNITDKDGIVSLLLWFEIFKNRLDRKNLNAETFNKFLAKIPNHTPFEIDTAMDVIAEKLDLLSIEQLEVFVKTLDQVSKVTLSQRVILLNNLIAQKKKQKNIQDKLDAIANNKAQPTFFENMLKNELNNIFLNSDHLTWFFFRQQLEAYKNPAMLETYQSLLLFLISTQGVASSLTGLRLINALRYNNMNWEADVLLYSLISQLGVDEVCSNHLDDALLRSLTNNGVSPKSLSGILNIKKIKQNKSHFENIGKRIAMRDSKKGQELWVLIEQQYKSTSFISSIFSHDNELEQAWELLVNLIKNGIKKNISKKEIKP